MRVNTIYFSFFLMGVLSMSLAHLGNAPLFFFLQALGQAFLEVGVFLWLALAFNRWTPRWLFHCFIGFSFAILLIHFVDFTVLRLMDTPISFMVKYLFGSGVVQLISTLQALNMNATMVCLIVLSLISIPIIGILFYRATQSLIPWKLSLQHLAFGLAGIGIGLYGLDLLCHPFLNTETYSKYQKALPLGTTFISPESQFFSLEAPLAQARKEASIQEALREKNFLAASRPNVYVFVIETLRKDYITPEIAPHLSLFGKENLSFEQSFSNSSSTQTSWFAIFHADFPHHWTKIRDSWQRGSVPLQILKSLGYRICVYSAADLRYYNMDQVLFGQGRQLVDQIEESSVSEVWQRDHFVVEAFLSDLEKPDSTSGNAFFFFLDSTHSEYSIPKDFPLRFEPMAKEIDYLTLSAKHIEPLKNRYRTAIAYVDSLFSRCLSKLKEKGLYDQAIIAVTGDHGEEFFEEGALFHGTHLNGYQLSIPLYYKFQNNPWIPLDIATTHLDLFPSILHYLTGRSDFEELFDGKSLFAPGRFPHCIAFLQNGREMPSECLIHNKSGAYRFRLHGPKSVEILDGKDLKLLDGGLFKFLLEKKE